MHNKDETSCFLGKVGTIGVRTSAWNSLAKMSIGKGIPSGESRPPSPKL